METKKQLKPCLSNARTSKGKSCASKAQLVSKQQRHITSQVVMVMNA